MKLLKEFKTKNINPLTARRNSAARRNRLSKIRTENRSIARPVGRISKFLENENEENNEDENDMVIIEPENSDSSNAFEVIDDYVPANSEKVNSFINDPEVKSFFEDLIERVATTVVDRLTAEEIIVDDEIEIHSEPDEINLIDGDEGDEGDEESNEEVISIANSDDEIDPDSIVVTEDDTDVDTDVTDDTDDTDDDLIDELRGDDILSFEAMTNAIEQVLKDRDI